MANTTSNINNTLLTDFYELTMANGYFELGMKDEIAYFDMFFRSVPDEGGYAIVAGLEQLVEYIQDLRFTEEDIEFLRSKNCFSEGFLEYLRTMKFECDVWAVPEGTPVFPFEPLVTIRGPIIQAQLIETFLLLTINHQTLIATKANRMVRAANGRTLMEFGSRRAQGASAAVLGARAAFIGGAVGTACTIAERDYGIPALGTMAHSWVQSFDSEYEAFKAYAEIYPDSTVLLVDTFNVLKSGIPNAIKVFDEVLKPQGKRPVGVRIDSGDIAYLSKKARAMLDAAGYQDCKIMASNSLDEYIVRDLLINDARIDSFGIGEKLITSRTNPVLGGVYKLVAVNKNGEYIPKIKISESFEKVTIPYKKQVWRIYSNHTGKAQADYLTMWDEDPSGLNELTIFSPLEPWKKQTLVDITIKPLLVPVFEKGKRVYDGPSLKQIRDYAMTQLDTLWDELKRLEYPHKYYVDLSDKLWAAQRKLLEEHHG